MTFTVKNCDSATLSSLIQIGNGCNFIEREADLDPCRNIFFPFLACSRRSSYTGYGTNVSRIPNFPLPVPCMPESRRVHDGFHPQTSRKGTPLGPHSSVHYGGVENAAGLYVAGIEPGLCVHLKGCLLVEVRM